jgi:hypothetical protein
MDRRVGRGWFDRMLSLVPASLLPAVHVLPTGRAHVRTCARGLSGPGVLPGRPGLSGPRHLPAELLAMATARGRLQRLLRIEPGFQFFFPQLTGLQNYLFEPRSRGFSRVASRPAVDAEFLGAHNLLSPAQRDFF